MATHSSILAWKVQWSEEPGGLQSTGSQRVGHTEPLSRHTRVIYKDVVVPFGVFSVLSVCSSIACKAIATATACIAVFGSRFTNKAQLNQ